MRRYYFLGICFLLCIGCATRPPARVDHICHIFRDHPSWAKSAKDVERRWKVPVPVQMAIVHQESKFRAYARPPRKKILGVIPGKRPTTAYGYSQVLNGTWREYTHDAGGFWSSRNDFKDSLDFIGWYANAAYRRAGISRKDPYALYLAYHEGIGGYQRKTYLKKSWLVSVAKKVKARAQIYEAQLMRCSYES